MRLYKCQGECGHEKPAIEFYQSKTGSVSPYCIECNTSACLLVKYKTEIRRQGSKAFAQKLHAKERQFNLMLRALKEVQV